MKDLHDAIAGGIEVVSGDSPAENEREAAKALILALSKVGLVGIMGMLASGAEAARDVHADSDFNPDSEVSVGVLGVIATVLSSAGRTIGRSIDG